jgi:hypothetical protein
MAHKQAFGNRNLRDRRPWGTVDGRRT